MRDASPRRAKRLALKKFTSDKLQGKKTFLKLEYPKWKEFRSDDANFMIAIKLLEKPQRIPNLDKTGVTAVQVLQWCIEISETMYTHRRNNEDLLGMIVASLATAESRRVSKRQRWLATFMCCALGCDMPIIESMHSRSNRNDWWIAKSTHQNKHIRWLSQRIFGLLYYDRRDVDYTNGYPVYIFNGGNRGYDYYKSWCWTLELFIPSSRRELFVDENPDKETSKELTQVFEFACRQCGDDIHYCQC